MGDVMDRAVVAESNRARVRRVLFDPLGFRAPPRVTAADHADALDALADELGYMADDRLEALRDVLRFKGQGPDRNRFPDRATVRAYAEQLQPRPITELPGLIRWFRSVEGPRAVADGTLVETLEFFQRAKAPPVTDGARARVRQEAADNARRLQIIGERVAAGLSVDPDDLAWRRAYLARRDQALALVAGRE